MWLVSLEDSAQYITHLRLLLFVSFPFSAFLFTMYTFPLENTFYFGLAQREMYYNATQGREGEKNESLWMMESRGGVDFSISRQETPKGFHVVNELMTLSFFKKKAGCDKKNMSPYFPMFLRPPKSIPSRVCVEIDEVGRR